MTNNRHDITEIVKNHKHHITEIVKHHNSIPNDK